MQGHFPIGSTLPGDAELMELFGVSRTALREALKTLAAKGSDRVQDQGRHQGSGSQQLEHVRCRHSRLASSGRRRCSLPRMAVRDPADAGAARLRHGRSAADAGAARDDAVAGCRGDVRMRDQPTGLHQGRSRPSIRPSSRHPAIPSCNPSARSSGRRLPHPSPSARPSRATSAFEEVMQQHQAVFDAIERRDPPAASDAMSDLILQAAERVQIKHAESALADDPDAHVFRGG